MKRRANQAGRPSKAVNSASEEPPTAKARMTKSLRPSFLATGVTKEPIRTVARLAKAVLRPIIVAEVPRLASTSEISGDESDRPMPTTVMQVMAAAIVAICLGGKRSGGGAAG